MGRRGARDGVGPIADQIIASREYDNAFGDWGAPGSSGIRYCAPNNRTSNQSVAPAAPVNQTARRFRGMDRNNDGVITEAEWHGSRRSFDVHDWNNDASSQATRCGRAPCAPDGPADTEFTAAPRAVPTSGQLVNVDSSERWTDTGIFVRAGDTIMFEVDGTIQMSTDPNDVAGPGGARKLSRRGVATRVSGSVRTTRSSSCGRARRRAFVSGPSRRR